MTDATMRTIRRSIRELRSQALKSDQKANEYEAGPLALYDFARHYRALAVEQREEADNLAELLPKAAG